MTGAGSINGNLIFAANLRPFYLIAAPMIEDILRSIFSAPPSQRRIEADLQIMAKEIQPWRDEVIPWEEENELELLSLQQEKKWVSHSMGKFLKGVFMSIYHEPMMAFAFKAYHKQGHYAVCFAATASHQFIYHRTKTRTEFFINGQHAGFMTADGLMYSHRKRLLGRRSRLSDEFFAMVIWDREAAHLRDPARKYTLAPRAFELVEKLSDKEELLLLAITFLTLIERSNNLGYRLPELSRG